jgi:hypothetical protein
VFFVNGIPYMESHTGNPSFLVLKTEVKFKNINFACVYLNDSSGNYLCIISGENFF